jgi:hypothetical protein
VPIDLKNILNKSELSRKDKVLVLLYFDDSSVKSTRELKTLGKANGLREIDKWNLSNILVSLNGLAIKLNNSWAITQDGQKHLKNQNIISISPIITHNQNLIFQAKSITSNYVREFVTEAIMSLEHGLLKSAVVFSWIGAVSLLYEHVEKNRLVDFNTEAKRRFTSWKDANNIDGLTRMKEFDFLQILEGLSIIGKNTKNELEHCLQLRNSCGHPSTLRVGENTVASHLEILILNVFNKFN